MNYLLIYSTILLLASTLIFLKKTNGCCKEFLSIEYTTQLRAIAIILIIIHHIGNILNCRLTTPLGGIGVAVFLIISGYGLNESFKVKGLNNYWKSKITRVIIPCWLIDTIFAIINYHTFNFVDYIQCLLCIKIDWFIRYLFYWYVIFYLSSKWFPKFRMIIMSIISMTMLCFLPEIEAEQSISFISGVFISSHKEKIINQKTLFISIFLLFVGLLALTCKQSAIIRNYSGTIIYNIVQLVIKYTLALFIIKVGWCIFKNGTSSMFLKFVGIISFELYLVHCKLLFILKDSPSFLCTTIFLILTFIGAYVMNRIDNNIAKKINHLWLK